MKAQFVMKRFESVEDDVMYAAPPLSEDVQPVNVSPIREMVFLPEEVEEAVMERAAPFEDAEQLVYVLREHFTTSADVVMEIPP